MAKPKKEIPTNQKGSVPIRWDAARGRFLLTTYDGSRKRTFFKTEAEALKAWTAHCRKVEDHGKQAVEYDAQAHREFEEAKRIVPGVDLREIARFYLSHHPQDAVDATVAGAVAQFQEQKGSRSLSARHFSGLKTHLKRFTSDFGKRSVREVTGNDVLNWLLGLAKDYDPRTIKNHHGSLCNFFNWCARRRMVVHAVTSDIDVSDLPVIPPKPKGVLSIDQSAAMMAWLEEHRPHFVAWHALQLFAGIRNAEAGRLQWEWINLEKQTITMPGWVFDDEGKASRTVKTGDDWVLHGLPETLWLWLAKYHKKDGRVRAPARDAIDRMRKKYFPLLPHPIPEWPQNAMRHTFCTMMISLHSDAAKVANWSRHTNVRQLYKSYVAKLVSKEEAERFFAITPAPSPAHAPAAPEL